MNPEWDDEEIADDEVEIIATDDDGRPLTGAGSLARVWQRALARFVDVFIVFNVAGVLTIVIVRPESADRGVLSALIVGTVFFVIAGLYEAGMVAWRGQTLGKMLVRIRVVRISDNAKPTPAEAFVRYAVPASFLYFTFIAPLVGELLWIGMFLTAIPNARRQGWHDRAAATLVLATR